MIWFTMLSALLLAAGLYVRRQDKAKALSAPSAEVYEVDEDDFAPELDRSDDFDYIQYKAEIDHWTAQMEQYKALQATHKAEIAAIRDYREKKLTLLPSLADKPIEYMELASWLNENKRDYSEKREAIVQRALITDANNIYACQKRIAKAQQKLREVA